VTVTSDPIPQILKGVPLDVRAVNVVIERAGGAPFMVNPTSCEPMRIAANLTSGLGTPATLATPLQADPSVPFQVTNCAALGFKPRFSVSTSAKTSRRNGASLHVKLAYPSASLGSQANIKSVRVELPRQLPSRLETLQKACPHKMFEANPAGCPSASKVGFARAITPLVPVPLEGPAYFVSYGGLQFPELIVVLQGYGVTLDLHGETFIDEHTNITSSTFKTVPDAPVGSFELDLPEGPDSALAANRDLCATNLAMPTTFDAQNGARLHQNTQIEVQGCPYSLRIVHRSVSHRTLTLKVSVPQAGRLSATGKGLTSSVKSTKGRSTLVLTLKERRVGKLRTKAQLRFTPSNGKQRKVLRKSLIVTFR
jgi:hypothetical protein